MKTCYRNIPPNVTVLYSHSLPYYENMLPYYTHIRYRIISHQLTVLYAYHVTVMNALTVFYETMLPYYRYISVTVL